MSTNAIRVLLNALADAKEPQYEIGAFAKLNITCDELPHLLPAVMKELQTLTCEEIDELDATDFQSLDLDDLNWEQYRYEPSISNHKLFVATHQSMQHFNSIRREQHGYQTEHSYR